MRIYSRRIHPFIHLLPTLINYYGLFHLQRWRRHRRRYQKSGKNIMLCHRITPLWYKKRIRKRKNENETNKHSIITEVPKCSRAYDECATAVSPSVKFRCLLQRLDEKEHMIGLCVRWVLSKGNFRFVAGDAGIRCASRSTHICKQYAQLHMNVQFVFFFFLRGCH